MSEKQTHPEHEEDICSKVDQCWSPATIAVSSSCRGTDSISLMRPLVEPICHSSTFKFKTIQDFTTMANNCDATFYSRLGTPNSLAVEATINELEGGAGSVVFSSGMAAITTAMLAILQPGDHIIAPNPLYSGTYSFINTILRKWNIEVTYVSAGSPVDEYERCIKSNTKMLFGETPCNPKIVILDLDRFGKLGKKHPAIVTMVDSTFASPFLQNTLKYGIDISMHSCTKYMGGHSDLLGGVLTTNKKSLADYVRTYRRDLGNPLSAFDCSLLERGLKTLPLRMEKHSSNALTLARYLEGHPRVKAVYYPGLESHPQHETASKQMTSFGGMIAMEMKGTYEESKNFVEGLRLVHLAVSLGGVESLVEHVSQMVHGPWIMTDDERKAANISDTLIRISVGIEDIHDLTRDFEQAFDGCSKVKSTKHEY